MFRGGFSQRGMPRWDVSGHPSLLLGKKSCLVNPSLSWPLCGLPCGPSPLSPRVSLAWLSVTKGNVAAEGSQGRQAATRPVAGWLSSRGGASGPFPSQAPCPLPGLAPGTGPSQLSQGGQASCISKCVCGYGPLPKAEKHCTRGVGIEDRPGSGSQPQPGKSEPGWTSGPSFRTLTFQPLPVPSLGKRARGRLVTVVGPLGFGYQW